MTVFGWTITQWEQVTKWAGEHMPAVMDNSEWPRMLEVRKRWLLAGGPRSGPSGQLIGLANG